MDLYINSTGWVTAAGINNDAGFLQEKISYESNRLAAREPDYAGIIPPMQLRRMSKAVRMGIVAAKNALKNAGVEKPDAIVVGTAMGCLQDTEIFLGKMVAQNEQMLTPTSFIQSTHNTVAGQVALLLGCNGHNLTYVHRGHSFEHALIDAQFYLKQNPEATVLAGGIDELTDSSFTLMQRAGVYSNEPVATNDVLNTSRNGSIAGEGAAFFLLSKKPLAKDALLLRKLSLFVAKDSDEAIAKYNAILKQLPTGLDLVLLGNNGDAATAAFYNAVEKTLPSTAAIANFKHQTGEYGTAGAAGLAFITEMMQKNIFPEQLFPVQQSATVNKVLFINQYLHHYAVWYIERA